MDEVHHKDLKYFSAKDPPPQPSLLSGPGDGDLSVCTNQVCRLPPGEGAGRSLGSSAYFTGFFSQGMAIYQSEVTELPKKLAKSALYLCCNYSAFWAKCQLFVSKLCTPPPPGQNRAKQGQNRAFLGIFRAFLGPFRAGSVTILSSFCPIFFVDSARPPQKTRPAPSRAGPTLAILAVLWVRLLCLFANPGRRLQRPKPRPDLVTLAKLSQRFLCAFPSRDQPRRPAFGYFSYISAANPRAPRSNRPPSSQWYRCPARCPCGGPASPPGRCAPFSGSPRPQWSAAAR